MKFEKNYKILEFSILWTTCSLVCNLGGSPQCYGKDIPAGPNDLIPRLTSSSNFPCIHVYNVPLPWVWGVPVPFISQGWSLLGPPKGKGLRSLVCLLGGSPQCYGKDIPQGFGLSCGGTFFQILIKIFSFHYLKFLA